MSNLNNLNSYNIIINGVIDRIRFTNVEPKNSPVIKEIKSLKEIKNNGKDDLVLSFKDGTLLAFSADKIEIAHGSAFSQEKVMPQKGDKIKMYDAKGDEGTLVALDIESEKNTDVKSATKPTKTENVDLKGAVKSSGEKSRDIIEQAKDKLKGVTSTSEFKDAKKEGHKVAKDVSKKADEVKDQLIPKDIQKDIKGISDKVNKLKNDITKKADKSFEGSLSSDDKKVYREVKKQTEKTSNKLKDSINDIFK